jgi:hypothetical protein
MDQARILHQAEMQDMKGGCDSLWGARWGRRGKREFRGSSGGDSKGDQRGILSKKGVERARTLSMYILFPVLSWTNRCTYV